MNKRSQPTNIPTTCHPAAKARGLLLALILTAGSAASVHAQGQLASGTIIGSGSGPSYSYSLTFSNAANATTNVGSVWYAWVPGQFFLPGVPTSASAPAGWSATVDNNSVQYVATNSIYDILPGHLLPGFGYQATFSPATLAATPNSGKSDAYSGGLFSSADDIFVVQQIPEPSSVALLILGGTALWFFGCRRFRGAMPTTH